MRVKAIQDLAQLTDPDLFVELAVGATLCTMNARQVYAQATLLAEQQHFRGAEILNAVAAEEAAKAMILLDAARCPRKPDPARFDRQLQYFNQHLAKGIYAEYCDTSPATLGEVARWIAHERREYYLDGPNGVDWIVYNDILRRREENQYVDYVGDDEQHYWHDPEERYQRLSLFSERPRNKVLRLASTLNDSGFFTADALATIATIWREADLEDGTHWQEIRVLNQNTLQKLNENGILKAASDAVLGFIVNEWLFPLTSLDLRTEKVSTGRLRDIQANYWE